MKRTIVGFRQDEESDWVAELACGHGQHVRHQPPFFNRPWVEKESSREEKLGVQLNCIRCDAFELPDAMHHYKSTPVFNSENLPMALQRAHLTKPGVWAQIHAIFGGLEYVVLEPINRQFKILPGSPGIVLPEVPHFIKPKGQVLVQVAFFKRWS